MKAAAAEVNLLSLESVRKISSSSMCIALKYGFGGGVPNKLENYASDIS